MIRHKEEKGKPLCKPKGFKQTRATLTAGDPRLRYHWDDVTCEACLALDTRRLKPRRNNGDDFVPKQAQGLADEILNRVRNSPIEDWDESGDD